MARDAVLAKVDAEPFEGWAIELGGVALTADRAGLLHIAAANVLVVSDLHLEKGSSRARRGLFLPPYDTRTTLARLGGAMDRLRPRLVVALGDSFHDLGGVERLGNEDRTALAHLQKGRDWLWIAGNHDPELPRELGGDRACEWRHGGVTFQHQPSAAAKAQVAGHLHPCARVSRDGHSQRRPCFAYGARKLLLPAFGAYAGGLNVLDQAIAGWFAGEMTVAVLGRSGVYPVPARHLRGD